MTIETKVKKVIAEKIPDIDIEDVVPEASLIDDLGADSLTIVELIMSMEEIFEIEIDDDAAENLLTVQNVIDFIKSKS
jgi:acyl carrier protein